MALASARGKLIGVIGDEVKKYFDLKKFLKLTIFCFFMIITGYLCWISSRRHRRNEQK